MPTRLKDLPTGFLWNAVSTNPEAQVFPWTVNGFAANEVPRSAVIDELRSRPEGHELLKKLKPKAAQVNTESVKARAIKEEREIKQEIEFYRNYKSRNTKRVVLVGNFQHPFTTESHHKWTWEQLGWEVSCLQENRTSTDAIIEACKSAQLFQYTHTHGWNTGGSFTLDETLNKIREMGIPSFSYHLDLYWGLGKLDQRENRIGQHPSWKVDYFFSTDGGHEEQYKERGVNHIWLPPAVVAYACHKGTYTPVLATDIAFVGSVGYHPEYPFRTEMIRKLQEHYGTKFRTYTGCREEKLNSVYASVKVVVGDHCFAGLPKYWSDRLPETCGRGGFIIYPETEGMTIPTATYKPQNVDDLIAKIDYYLANENERLAIQDAAFNYVRQHDTYSQRLAFILEKIFG